MNPATLAAPIAAALAALSVSPPAARAQERSAGDVEMQEMKLTTATGREITADRGRLWVPENRRRDGSRLIELAFGRLRSTADEPGPPLIYLHGGPGGSATSAVDSPAALAAWARFLPLGDVVLLDQRGCGRSKPNLAVRIDAPPPPDVFLSRARNAELLAEGSRIAKAELAEMGVDVTGYDTEQNADDVDDLRRALGAERMRLFGFSYGTHLGLSVIRRHGAHVDAAILIGVEGPAETRKLPSVYDTQIKKLSLLIAADPDVGEDVPDFEALLRRVLRKLADEPIEVQVPQPVTGNTVTVPVGAEGLSTILVRDFGDTNDLPVFPRLLWEIDQGRTEVLAWFVRKRYSQMRGFPTLAFTMDPASGCPPARAARIAAEARDAILGDAMNFVFEPVEAVWNMPTLPDSFREPIVSDVRTLFVSGTLDANTPPHQAETIRWGFTRGVHLVQAFGGHEDWFRNPKIAPVLLDFLAGEDVRGRDVDMPPLRFIPVEGPPRGVTHPSVSAR